MIVIRTFDFSKRHLLPLHYIAIKDVHTTAILHRARAGRFHVSKRRDNPLTYEELYPPSHIFRTKSFNSINTSNLLGGLRRSETLVEDAFIRLFIYGTWPQMFLSKVIIKRRANIIIIAGLITQKLPQSKIYFLVGYTEEILSQLFKCIVKMEIQTVNDPKAIIVKYV